MSIRTLDYENAAILAAVIVAVIALIAVYIFFLLTIRSTLQLIRNKNRLMSPDQVWLMLIPFFNLFWQFILVYRLSHSINNEFKSRGTLTNHTQLLYLGRAACILNCLSNIDYIESICSIGAFICWGIFWIRISGVKRQLMLLPEQTEEDSQIFGNNIP